MFEHISELKPLVFYEISITFQAKLIKKMVEKRRKHVFIQLQLIWNMLVDNIFPYK